MIIKINLLRWIWFSPFRVLAVSWRKLEPSWNPCHGSLEKTGHSLLSHQFSHSRACVSDVSLLVAVTKDKTLWNRGNPRVQADRCCLQQGSLDKSNHLIVTDMTHNYYFFRTVKVGGRQRLRPLPHQKEPSGRHIDESLNVQADSRMREDYPLGTDLSDRSQQRKLPVRQP